MFDQLSLKVNLKLSQLIAALCTTALLVEFLLWVTHPIVVSQGIFLTLFTGITVLLLVGIERAFVPLFLLSTFTLITAWRLSALAQYTAATWILTLAVFLKLINYLLFSIESIQHNKSISQEQHQATRFEWQLMFIRLFIGLDLIPHFCEKLFAGAAIRADDIQAFMHLNVPHPAAFVLVAGLVELAGALSLSCGFITRLGSFCLAIYMMVATYLGHHFSKGFIWASQGGGWEYPVLWTVLILSFTVFGAGHFSIDQYLKTKLTLPRWIKRLMGGQHV